ncbi:MAG: DUF3450 family protein [Chitinispirillaceae bacterium]
MRCKHSMKKLSLIALLTATAAVTQEHDTEMANLRSQIESYKSKVRDVRAKIDHETTKAAADSSSYAAYVSEHSRRSGRIRNERDSLLVLAEKLRHRRDSLAHTEAALDQQRVSSVNQQKILLTDLREKCSQLIDTLGAFEPFNIRRQISALRFLESEITAATVSAAEGLERYWNIVSQIESASSRIESWSGDAPVPALKGDVRFLRMGFVWLACVGGDNAPVFVYYPKQQTWEELDDLEKAASVRKAVQVANGMTSPQLVSLPVNLTLVPAHEEAGR